MIDNRKLASKKTVVNNKQQDLQSEAEVLVSSLRTVPMFNSVMFNKDQYVSIQTYIHTYIVYLVTQVTEYARLKS